MHQRSRLSYNACLFFFLVFFVPWAEGQVTSTGKCAVFDSKHKFAYSQFYTGVWYVMEGYPNRYYGNVSCEELVLNADEKYVYINDTVYNTSFKRFQTIEGKAKFRPKKSLNRLTLSPGIKSLPQGVDLWVVSTDYSNYALIYLCQQNNPFTKKEYIYILSRIPALLPGLRARLIVTNVVGAGLPVAPLAPMEQTTCPTPSALL